MWFKPTISWSWGVCFTAVLQPWPFFHCRVAPLNQTRGSWRPGCLAASFAAMPTPSPRSSRPTFRHRESKVTLIIYRWAVPTGRASANGRLHHRAQFGTGFFYSRTDHSMLKKMVYLKTTCSLSALSPVSCSTPRFQASNLTAVSAHW